MEKLPKQVPYDTGNRNDGFIYEDKVVLYAAASLSRNDAVNDFWLVNNPRGIESFDDVVLRVSFKNGEDIAVFAQVKLTEKSLLLLIKDEKIRDAKPYKNDMPIKLFKYKKDAKKIMDIRNSEQNIFQAVFKDVDTNKHFFCIFTTSKSCPKVYPEGLLLKPVDARNIRFMDASNRNTYLQLTHTDDANEESKNTFYKQLFILHDQPDVDNIDCALTNILGEHFIDRNIAELTKRIKKFTVRGSDTVPLTKKTFDMMCLEVLLNDWVLEMRQMTSENTSNDIDEWSMVLWQQIFSTEYIINIHNFEESWPILAYLFQQVIRDEIDKEFSWQAGPNDNIKEIVKNRYQQTVNDNKDLVFLMWQLDKLPLPVKVKYTEEFISTHNRYKYLKKRFIIFRDTDADTNADIDDDVGTKVINNVQQLSSETIRDEVLNIFVSFQGRLEMPLDKILGTTDMKSPPVDKILENITISHILNWTVKGPNQRNRIVGPELSKPNDDYIHRQLIRKVQDAEGASNTVEEQNNTYDDYLLKVLPYSLITIASEPGMGKSELLRSLAYHYTPEKLVLFINLRDCRADLASEEEDIFFDPIKYFFSKTTQDPDDLSRSLLECHRVNNNLALFIDQYDEILPEHRNKVKNIIEVVLKDNRMQVFLATRTHTINELPRMDETLSLNLLPLSDEDISIYCAIKGVSKPTSIEQTMLNNPLQLHMITKICKEDTSFNNLGIADIYVKFIEQKHSLYCEKESMNSYTKNMLSNLSTIFHRKSAMVGIFGERFSISKELIHTDELQIILQFIKDQNLGLALPSEHLPFVQFIHQTYAEFFVADWLHVNRHNKKKFESIYREIVENSIYRNIYCIFDNLTCRSKAHKAHKAAMSDTNKLIQLVNSLDNSVLSKDDLGRNIAHILAWYGQFNDVHKELYTRLIKSVIASSLIYRLDAILRCTNEYFEKGYIDEKSTDICELLEHIENIKKNRIEKTSEFFNMHPDVLRGPVGTIAFHTAIIKKDFVMVQLFLTYKMDVYQEDTNGNNALHISCALGLINITRLLLAKMSQINKPNAYGDTALHLAARHGILIDIDPSNRPHSINDKTRRKYTALLKLLLDKEPNSRAVNSDGNNVLHFAAQNGNLEMIKMIFENDDVEQTPNKKGWTPLHFAAAHGDVNVVEFLLSKAGAIENPNTSNTVVVEASKAGHYKVIKCLIQKGADLKASDMHGWAPLHHVSSQGNLEIAKLLLLNGADVNMKTNDESTPLIEGCKTGYTSIVELLLASGADPNQSDKNHWNGLHYASARGDVETVDLLIKNGTHVNNQNIDGDTALTLASSGGHLIVVNILLTKGCNFMLRNKYGFNALHVAACRGDFQIVKLLVQTGVDINDKCDDGDTAINKAYVEGHTEVIKYLHEKGSDVYNNERLSDLIVTEDRESDSVEVNQQSMLSAAENGELGTVKLLLAKDADVNHTIADGVTPMALASASGHTDIVQHLLTANGSPFQEDNQGWTPFHYAAHNGHLKPVELFLTKGVNVNLPTRDGRTAMCLAAESGHTHVVQHLIGANGDPLQADNNGMIPLHSAAYNGRLEVVELLLPRAENVNHSRNDGCTAICLAAKSGHINTVEYLFNENGDPLQANTTGWTPLHHAAYNGHLEVVEFLLSHGIDSNLTANNGCTAMCMAAESGHTSVVKSLMNANGNPLLQDDTGRMPFHYAAHKGHLEIVKRLLNKGIDVNHSTKNGRTAMSFAAEGGHADVVHYLINVKGNPLQDDEDGWTPFHYTAYKGHLEVVKLLLGKNIDVNQPTKDRRTAISLASEAGHSDIVLYLIDANADPSQVKKQQVQHEPKKKSRDIRKWREVYGHMR